MTTHRVEITLQDIQNDGNTPTKSTIVNAGDNVEYWLGPDAVTGNYSFQESDANRAIDNIVSKTIGISNAQATSFLEGTAPVISGPDQQNLTLNIAANALACVIEFNIRIKEPSGQYFDFDPLITVIPK